jgi:uncharacterized protein (TIGR02147 family)
MAEPMTYRLFFTREFARRCQKNPRYSLRAFARDLSLPASRLSEILRSQSGLSEGAALLLGQKLNLTPSEVEMFQLMVSSEHSRSRTKREQAADRLKILWQNQGVMIMDSEKANIISDWYYSAILELTDVIDFQPDEHWISQRLNVNLEKVHLAIQRLFQFGLLAIEEGRWRQTQKQLTFNSAIANNEFKKHHLQLLEKAGGAISDLTNDEREISSVTLAINSEQLPEFRKMLSTFRRNVMLEAEKGNPKNRVYGMTLHFFPVDQISNGELAKKRSRKEASI